MIKKNNVYKYFYIFLSSHLLIWTVIPSISNVNLPLDTIEALAWGSNLDWGFNKHPPLSAFAVEVVYRIFGNQDWAYYILSQIFVVFSFIVIFKLSLHLFNNPNYALLSIFLLEGIFFYNFTTPEFNVNIAQLPFWALTIYFSYRCIKHNKITDFILLGLFIGLGILSKYLFLYLVAGVKLLFLYLIFKKKKLNLFYLLIPGLITLAVIMPHLMWLYENNFTTIRYGFNRTGGIGSLSDHIFLPVFFIFKQIGLLLPILIMSYFLIKKMKKIKINFSENNVFVFFMFLVPIILIVLTSILFGVKIRTMWMTPFYLLAGVFIIEILKKHLNIKSLNKFYVSFLFFFFLSPILYLLVSLNNDHKRTDYPGKEIARLVQNKWDNNFTNEIKIVIGDEWYAGNLSYHLYSRPVWINDFKEKSSSVANDEGVIYTGNPKILKKICPGVFGTIRPVGYCMIGRK